MLHITYILGNTINMKWQNIRDVFLRSLRKSGQRYTKNYIYSNHLQFLLKIVQKINTESRIDEEDLLVSTNDENNLIKVNRSP